MRRGAAAEVVLLHGWSSGPAVWRAFAARLSPLRASAPDLAAAFAAAGRPRKLEDFAVALAREAPPRCHVVGWSLGALLALAWAKRMPQQVARLGLIAATPSFVARRGWTPAMAPATLLAFERDFAAEPGRARRRFIALQAQDDARRAAVARALRATPAPADAALAAGLAWLRETDLRGELAALQAPALVIHGARDRIVPPAAGERLARLMPEARYVAVPGAAHAPFLSDPGAVAAALREHLDG